MTTTNILAELQTTTRRMVSEIDTITRQRNELQTLCGTLEDTLETVGDERDALLETIQEIWGIVGNGHEWKRPSQVTRAVKTALNDAHGGLLPGCDTITIGGK